MHRFCRLIILLLLTAPAVVVADDWRFDGVSRIVAISDVHGAYDPMVRTLGNAGVIDANRHWAGGDTHLVIVGDLLDRGPDSRDAMDLLMQLEGEAAAAGGRVHVLIGNHEVMNLVGDLRYVSREEYAAFAAEETAAERDRWFDAFAGRHPERDESVLRAEFDESFPPGFFAHRRAFAPDGRYGAWLLGKPLLVVINGTAFVHGGLSPMIAGYGLDGVNEKLRGDLGGYVEALATLTDAEVLLPMDNFYDHDQLLADWLPAPSAEAPVIEAAKRLPELGQSDIHSPDGPLWYRGNVACSPLVEKDRLDATLAVIGADRVVIGHTPTLDRHVLERLDGRVVEVDTGMLSGYYGGRGHALLIEGDELAVVSEDSGERFAPEPHPRDVGARPDGFITAKSLEELLRTGDIVGDRKDEQGRRVVTVSDGERTVEALFAKREARGFYPDVAAYRLDRLLGLDLVTVAVLREVDGDDGSLQFLPARFTDEALRAAAGHGGSASCPLRVQWPAMYAFDTLIYNEGRSQQRMLYSPASWQLVLVGHEDAFGKRTGRPRYLQAIEIELGDAWISALDALDASKLESELGDVLDARRRDALLKRRDELLEAAYAEAG